MEIVHTHGAGLDVHKTTVVAALAAATWPLVGVKPRQGRDLAQATG
jgi:hypothetical protein